MYFEKFLTNTKSMFTGFDDTDDLLNKAHNIRLQLHKIHMPSLTQVKNELQV